jgi:glucan phosphoethanolaminetransferase (alkaline phosphatase superfamily)
MALKIFSLFFVYALYLAAVFTIMMLIVHSTNHSDLGTSTQTAQAELILLIVLVGLPPVLFTVNSLRGWIKRATTRQTDQEAIAADHQPT